MSEKPDSDQVKRVKEKNEELTAEVSVPSSSAWAVSSEPHSKWASVFTGPTAAGEQISASADAYLVMESAQSSAREAEFQRRIQGLEATVKELRSAPAAGEFLTQRFEQVEAAVLGVRAAGLQLSAPVVLPGPESMTVRLVSVSSLESLDELRSDEKFWLAAATLFIGMAGGAWLGALLSGTQILPDRAALMIMVGAFGLFMGAHYVRVHRRAKRLRALMLASTVRKQGDAGDALDRAVSAVGARG